MAFLLLLLAGLAACASGQCFSSDCATCLSNPSCYFYVRCGQCTSVSGGTCDGQSSMRYAGDCPADALEAARPLSTAYWTLSIAFVASGFLVALLYSPLEQLCGQRQSSGSAHRGFGCNSYLLLISCWCLWLGVSLILSAPLLPWLVNATTSFTIAVTAFNVYQCQYSTTKSSLCTVMTTFEFVDDFSRGRDTIADIQYIDQAFSLGVVGYIACIGLLLPCALMASMAAYRLRRFEKTGIPPYTSGCSPASLAVAQMLGWPALFVLSILAFTATSLCLTVKNLLNTYVGDLLSGGTAEFTLMPGPVAAGVGMMFQFLGLILLAVVSRALSSVHGVGCNGGGCCRLAVDDGLDPAAAHAPPQDGTSLLSAGRRPAAAAYTQPSHASDPVLSVGSA